MLWVIFQPFLRGCCLEGEIFINLEIFNIRATVTAGNSETNVMAKESCEHTML